MHIARFAAQPAVHARIEAALAALDAATSRGERRDLLAALRADLQRMPMPDDLTAPWQARWQQQLNGDGVFVRSSSNSEDLANFSGAGLYTTVPNVRQHLADAVRTVWASVWNAEAFEARRAAGLRHTDVVMAVLVQRAVDARTSGVMITRQGGAIVPVPFEDIMDPKTGRTRVRLVDTSSESHASARALQVRIEREDLETSAQLDALAQATKLTPQQVAERYAEIV